MKSLGQELDVFVMKNFCTFFPKLLIYMANPLLTKRKIIKIINKMQSDLVDILDSGII